MPRVGLMMFLDEPLWVLGRSRGGAAWDADNLQPLCRACHEAKSAREHRAAVKRVGRNGVPLTSEGER